MVEIRCASHVQDDGVFVFGLAEEPDGGGWSLIFQSEADQPGHCLSTPNGATSYGALEAWTTEDDVLSLRLTSQGATELGLPQHLCLRLDPEYVDVREVLRALAFILRT